MPERRTVKPKLGKERAMHVEIRAKHGRLNRSLKAQLVRRLRFAFTRFGGRIRRVCAFVEDINGPRGGEDQHCKIKVILVPSGSIMAEATDVKVASAVGRAAERVVRQVRDALDRKRNKRARTRGETSRNDSPLESL